MSDSHAYDAEKLADMAARVAPKRHKSCWECVHRRQPEDSDSCRTCYDDASSPGFKEQVQGVEPSTPRDWARWLTESARDGSTWLSVDQARRLALVLEGLVATVAQLEAECHRLQEEMPWAYRSRVETVVSRCEICVHRAMSVARDPCRQCLDSGVATEFRPDPALEGGRHG